VTFPEKKTEIYMRKKIKISIKIKMWGGGG